MTSQLKQSWPGNFGGAVRKLGGVVAFVALVAPQLEAAVITSDLLLSAGGNLINADDPAVLMENGATVTINAGGLIQKNNSAGDDVALQLGRADGSQNGFLVMNGGEIEANDTGGAGASAIGIELYGSSTALISDGLVDVNESVGGGARGFRAYDSSSVNFTGGSLLINESNSGVGMFAEAFDNAVVNLSGGLLQLDESGDHHAIGFRANGNSIINLMGGTISVNESDGGDARLFEALGGGAINISGGDWSLTGTVEPSIIGAGSVLTVFGTGFNFAYGAIAAPTGTLTGMLSDGSTFSLPFDQSPGGSIILSAPVPEPSTYLLSLVLVLSGVAFSCNRRKAG